jgi:hypothetical protein
MIGRHLGRHLTEELRKRWLALMLATADEMGLPSDPEFRAAFVGWGRGSPCSTPRTASRRPSIARRCRHGIGDRRAAPGRDRATLLCACRII